MIAPPRPPPERIGSEFLLYFRSAKRPPMSSPPFLALKPVAFYLAFLGDGRRLLGGKLSREERPSYLIKLSERGRLSSGLLRRRVSLTISYSWGLFGQDSSSVPFALAELPPRRTPLFGLERFFFSSYIISASSPLFILAHSLPRRLASLRNQASVFLRGLPQPFAHPLFGNTSLHHRRPPLCSK